MTIVLEFSSLSILELLRLDCFPPFLYVLSFYLEWVFIQRMVLLQYIQERLRSSLAALTWALS